jgi:hypothetical protein
MAAPVTSCRPLRRRSSSRRPPSPRWCRRWCRLARSRPRPPPLPHSLYSPTRRSSLTPPSTSPTRPRPCPRSRRRSWLRRNSRPRLHPRPRLLPRRCECQSRRRPGRRRRRRPRRSCCRLPTRPSPRPGRSDKPPTRVSSRASPPYAPLHRFAAFSPHGDVDSPANLTVTRLT